MTGLWPEASKSGLWPFVSHCLPCFSGLQQLLPIKQDTNVSYDNAMHEVTHGISQESLEDTDTQTKVKMRKLLEEGMDNGTLEEAFVHILQQRQTAKEDSAKDLVKQMLEVSAKTGVLQAALAEDMRARKSGKPLSLTELFSVVQEVFSENPHSNKDMETNVGKLLQDAVDNGTIEKALSAPALVQPLPLPSCPGLSARSLKQSIKNLLEDGVAKGNLRFDQAVQLRNLISTYNRAQSQRQPFNLEIIDHSKPFQYTPPERRLDVSDIQANAPLVSSKAKLSKLDVDDMFASDLEKELQEQERAADLIRKRIAIAEATIPHRVCQ